jgi:hypothetical protein
MPLSAPLQNYCIKQIKAGDNSQWTIPAIGSACTPVNLSYVPGKFDNASRSVLSTEYAFSNDKGAFIDKNHFGFDCWFATNSNITNGGSSDVDTLMDWRSTSGSNDIILMRFTSGGLQFIIRVDGLSITYTITNPLLTWLAGEKQHMSFFYDQLGIDGGAVKARVYLNRVEVFSSTTGNDESSTLNNQECAFLNTFVFNNSFNGWMDNIKVYNKYTDPYITSDLELAINNNNENEGFPALFVPNNQFNKVTPNQFNRMMV